ncbi:uncharacterized protein LOC132448990 [Gadus macrocephalus]|uniref:uncharacterized protein LOC132448990 n=1 Tax=Gadus macrocephalus TaxID=80720 RepID=UPI0028CBB6C4|nr:uncharacterized protein LOC132448990 [Gadus macrocephalus]
MESVLVRNTFMNPYPTCVLNTSWFEPVWMRHITRLLGVDQTIKSRTVRPALHPSKGLEVSCRRPPPPLSEHTHLYCMQRSVPTTGRVGSACWCPPHPVSLQRGSSPQRCVPDQRWGSLVHVRLTGPAAGLHTLHCSLTLLPTCSLLLLPPPQPAPSSSFLLPSLLPPPPSSSPVCSLLLPPPPQPAPSSSFLLPSLLPPPPSSSPACSLLLPPPLLLPLREETASGVRPGVPTGSLLGDVSQSPAEPDLLCPASSPLLCERQVKPLAGEPVWNKQVLLHLLLHPPSPWFCPPPHPPWIYAEAHFLFELWICSPLFQRWTLLPGSLVYLQFMFPSSFCVS